MTDQTALPASEITALLGRGTRFEGKLHFTGRVRIDGTFRGEIRSDDVLIVGEGADVEGEIRVATVIIRGGRVDARVLAERAIELYVPAQVTGSLQAPEIFMDKGCSLAAPAPWLRSSLRATEGPRPGNWGRPTGLRAGEGSH
ncbi:MAG: polymer-forming cytoskeletal protein [Polyangiaceae bacterium]